MNLHDPLRPKVQNRPAFIDGDVVIPQLNLWPTKDPELVEISAMLRVVGEGPFVSKSFRTEIKLSKLPELISQFNSDPESTLSFLFGTDPSGFVPSISLEPSEKCWAKDQRRSREQEESQRRASRRKPTHSSFSIL